ncbi:MAG: hypothetical protein N2170_00750 [Bacteroidia bacterium]|nr:hypothetical protein [Bacteroidia bacterium]
MAPKGFWVGYPVFSRLRVGTMVGHHIPVESFPLAAFSALTGLGTT